MLCWTVLGRHCLRLTSLRPVLTWYKVSKMKIQVQTNKENEGRDPNINKSEGPDPKRQAAKGEMRYFRKANITLSKTGGWLPSENRFMTWTCQN